MSQADLKRWLKKYKPQVIIEQGRYSEIWTAFIFENEQPTLIHNINLVLALAHIPGQPILTNPETCNMAICA